MYSRYFQKFLDHTDEKEIFVHEISAEIKAACPQSLLDIGAGNGSLSIPLAALMPRYLAIERNDNHVAQLRAVGLNVLQDEFPCEVPGQFDFILVSHALSYGPHEDQETFLRQAWELLTPRGTLLVITYRSEQDDDWTYLMGCLDEVRQGSQAEGYRKTLGILSNLGEMHVRQVETHVRTESLDDMVQALAFVASDGNPAAADRFLAKRSRLQQVLDAEYDQGEEYVFPFRHFFISTRKHTKS